VGQLVAGVDKFYMDSSNRRIFVLGAVLAVEMETQGIPADKRAEAIEEMRRTAATTPEP
jgi:hypothetical protein